MHPVCLGPAVRVRSVRADGVNKVRSERYAGGLNKGFIKAIRLKLADWERVLSGSEKP